MAGAGRWSRRLRAVAAGQRARRAARAEEPPFDPARLTGAELAEAETLGRRGPWRNGRHDFSGLTDDEFARLAFLVSTGKGLDRRG